MKQFYETYFDNEKLSPLSRELSWSNNMEILSAANSMEEREFYFGDRIAWMKWEEYNSILIFSWLEVFNNIIC
jgi:hypothetical protein